MPQAEGTAVSMTAQPAKDTVLFQGKKGVWRTTHGTHIFIPSDGSPPIMPKRGVDIKLKRKGKKLSVPEPKQPPAKEPAPEPKKTTLRQKLALLKGAAGELSDMAKEFVSSAPGHVRKFFTDSAHRKEVLGKTKQALKEFPAKAVQALVDTAHEEVREFKKAAQAIGKIAKRDELDHHEIKALKTVMFHLGLQMAKAAIHVTGSLASLPVAVVTGVVKHVVLKAISRHLAHAHVAHEGVEIGHEAAHGILHAVFHAAKHAAEGIKMSDKKSALTEAVSPRLILKFFTDFKDILADEFDKLTPEDIAKIADEVAKEANKKAKAKHESRTRLGSVIQEMRSLVEDDRS